MKFAAEIRVMPLKELLDPQGKAVMGGLNQMGLSSVKDVRVGKHILLDIEAADKNEALRIATEASKKLLSNPVMETFEISVS
mgnify:CR=1 FL=1